MEISDEFNRFYYPDLCLTFSVIFFIALMIVIVTECQIFDNKIFIVCHSLGVICMSYKGPHITLSTQGGDIRRCYGL